MNKDRNYREKSGKLILFGIKLVMHFEFIMKKIEQKHGRLMLPSGKKKTHAFAVLLLLLTGANLLASAQTKKEQDMIIVKKQNTVKAINPIITAHTSDDEAAILALESGFADALNAGNIDAMMKNYITDNSLIVFDVVPPRQHVGADAYRKAWVGFFSSFKGLPKITITDLSITVDGNLGFSHSIQHVTGTDRQGNPVDRPVRVTDGYRKIAGNWLIVLEHISVPVDLKTNKPDINSKP